MLRLPHLVVAALVLAAACSDPGTSPTAPLASAPASAKSTLGNPQFSSQFTVCNPGEPLPPGTTHVGCDYKITGGGNTASATITLEAPVLFDGRCQNNGGQVVPVKDFALTISASQPNLRLENGQISGSISVDLSQAVPPGARAVCPNGNWTVIPETFAFAGRYQLSALVFSGTSSITILSAYQL